MALVEQLPPARRQILDCFIARQIDSQQAATLLDVSGRQFYRLLAAYLQRGKDALTHGNPGAAGRGTQLHRTSPPGS